MHQCQRIDRAGFRIARTRQRLQEAMAAQSRTSRINLRMRFFRMAEDQYDALRLKRSIDGTV